MRIATWNVNSLKVRLPRVEEWLAYAKPDILCMQETKLADDAFPAMDFTRMGYEWAHHGEGRWNGVAILSKVGISDVVNGFGDGFDDERSEARAITARCGDIRVTSIYVPNGRSLDNEMYQWKLQWLERLHGFLETGASSDDKVVVTGDFNIAPADIDVYPPPVSPGKLMFPMLNESGCKRSWIWACTTCSVSNIPMRRISTRGGITAPGTSTRASACALT
jgi:exodeoxyribonuclease III